MVRALLNNDSGSVGLLIGCGLFSGSISENTEDILANGDLDDSIDVAWSFVEGLEGDFIRYPWDVWGDRRRINAIIFVRILFIMLFVLD